MGFPIEIYFYTAVQSKNAVSAHLASKQILHFGLAEQYSRTGI